MACAYAFPYPPIKRPVYSGARGHMVDSADALATGLCAAACWVVTNSPLTKNLKTLEVELGPFSIEDRALGCGQQAASASSL